MALRVILLFAVVLLDGAEITFCHYSQNVLGIYVIWSTNSSECQQVVDIRSEGLRQSSG